MSYIPPSLVVSPKTRVQNVKVIVDNGEGSWSLAELIWDGSPAFGIRWNGGDEGGIGTPQSRGIPMWFILPQEVADAYLASIGDK